MTSPFLTGAAWPAAPGRLGYVPAKVGVARRLARCATPRDFLDRAQRDATVLGRSFFVYARGITGENPKSAPRSTCSQVNVDNSESRAQMVNARVTSGANLRLRDWRQASRNSGDHRPR